jgi:hypothetical protein
MFSEKAIAHVDEQKSDRQAIRLQIRPIAEPEDEKWNDE